MKNRAKFIAGSLGLILTAAVSINPWMQDPQGATQTLKDNQLEPAKVGGYGWFSCGTGDIWKTRFEATNAKGATVHGTVCKGLFKGSTIRFD
jgi:hypothetical protein